MASEGWSGHARPYLTIHEGYLRTCDILADHWPTPDEQLAANKRWCARLGIPCHPSVYAGTSEWAEYSSRQQWLQDYRTFHLKGYWTPMWRQLERETGMKPREYL